MSRNVAERVAEILKRLGVKVTKKAIAEIEEIKEAEPDTPTEDIILRLSLAPPDLIEKAIEQIECEGDANLFVERFERARKRVKEQKAAALRVSDAAAAIAAKG
jgi:transcriptional regulator with XRE-family HTH domain